ncbi:MAG: hypothetical protein GY953_12430, partial [bacterium]|nr:hypothetical protein [bacterium]
VRAFLTNLRADLGFSERNLLVADIFYRGSQQQGDAFWEQLRDRISAAPGVEQAAYALRAPLGASGSGRAAEVRIPGYEMPPGVENLRIKYARVTANYFQALGIRLLRGELFSEDNRDRPNPVVINESMARHYFQGGEAIDEVIHIVGRAEEDRRVIGIVQDTTISYITEPPEPYFYVPFPPGFRGGRSLLVETSGDPTSRAQLIRSEIENLD